MPVHLSKLKKFKLKKTKFLLCPQSYSSIALWARCSKCRRIYYGFEVLKEQGFFSSFSEFICKKCKEEGKKT
jgi:hypothetical protein